MDRHRELEIAVVAFTLYVQSQRGCSLQEAQKIVASACATIETAERAVKPLGGAAVHVH